jgi:hypothetical protein
VSYFTFHRKYGVIAFYDKIDKRVLALDASKYDFNKASGTGGRLKLNVSIGGVVKYYIVFVSDEDRNHMIKQLDWFIEHGNPSYAAVLIDYASDWWLEM